ncbi:hypothetical protein Bca4012_010227 [Brassica carinata]
MAFQQKVVKLFNAVNKAQHAQKGLNTSRTSISVKEAKKRSILLGVGKKDNRLQASPQKASNSTEDEAPAWAPLRDNYMLANPKLKDWDKKQVSFKIRV